VHQERRSNSRAENHYTQQRSLVESTAPDPRKCKQSVVYFTDVNLCS